MSLLITNATMFAVDANRNQSATCRAVGPALVYVRSRDTGAVDALVRRERKPR